MALLYYVEFKIIDKMLDLDVVPETDLRFNVFNIHAYAKVIYQGKLSEFLKTTLRKEEKRGEFEDQIKRANLQTGRTKQ